MQTEQVLDSCILLSHDVTAIVLPIRYPNGWQTYMKAVAATKKMNKMLY